MKIPKYGLVLKWACLATILGAFLVLVIAINTYQAETERTEELEAHMTYFNDFSLSTVDGGTFSQDDLKDYKVTVVNGWATWCGSCVSEMPDLEKLNQKYKEKGLQIVGLIADYYLKDDAGKTAMKPEIDDIIQKTTVTYPCMYSDQAFGDEVSPTTRNALPCTWAIDKEGNLIEVVHGSNSEEKWSEYFDKWLEETK